jgi:hypothetical protein
LSNPAHDQFFERTLKSAATFLARWSGADVQLWELTASHRTLKLLLTRPGSTQNLVISCLDPIRIEAPVRWPNASLSLRIAPLPDGDNGFLITDSGQPVSILSGSVELAENVKAP